ncbi:Uncharacterized protein Rs2_18451 [Raphanus sativus]|nr:Uncharacterized protein Rs2_18451 [Raphanus sativus]
MAIKTGDGDGLLVSTSDTLFAYELHSPVIYRFILGCVDDIPFAYGLFSPVIYMLLLLFGGVDWPSIRSCFDLPTTLPFEVEEKIIVTFTPMNMDGAGYDFPLVPHLNQSYLLIFPPIESEMDEQVSLVLQGSSSLRMLSSAYGAVGVISRVTLDAVLEEAYDVVIRFHLVSVWDFLAVNSLVIVVSLAVNSLVVSSSVRG